MSLEYTNDESRSKDVPAENTEDVQRVFPVIPYYSIFIIICLAAVSLTQIAVDGWDSFLFGGAKSVSSAGLDKHAFFAGQYWRILTGAALHGGLIHLGFNCYALYTLGKIIETISNRAHLAVIFLLSAIGGNILSLIFLPDAVPSVGASGGIIGFLGYLAVYGYIRRKLLTNSFLKDMLFNIAFIAFYGFILREKIDNFAHLGGLLTGAIYGFIQIPRDLHKDPRIIGSLTEIAGLAALGTFIFTAILSILLILNIITL